MRVYISIDMEGIAGVVNPEDTKLEGIEYERARHWMTKEANAAVESALKAGASEVVVNDSHGHMRNLLVDELHPEAYLIRGNMKPFCMVEGIEPGFDAAFFIGYHAMAGTAGGVLNHTFYGRAVYQLRLNGIPVGESGFNAAVVGAFGVPVAMVTGDEALGREVQNILPWAERVVVKKGITSWSAKSVSPTKAQEMIRLAATDSLKRIKEMKLLKFDSPVRFEVEFFRASMADNAAMVPGAERLNGTTVLYIGKDILDVNRAWLTMMNAIANTMVGYG
jgi:D-amino peptidase